MYKNVNSVLFLLIVLLTACKSNKKDIDSYNLEGKWSIYEAYRNNEITNTLEAGYFKFMDSTMETNILGSPIRGKYVLDNEGFFHDSSLPAEYEISSYVKDTMELNTEIKGFEFKFKLHRVQDSIPNE